MAARVVIEPIVYNPKYTQTIAHVCQRFENYYPAPEDRVVWGRYGTVKFVAEEGDFIVVEHTSGSAKHTYYNYVILLRVVPGKKAEGGPLSYAENVELVAYADLQGEDLRLALEELEQIERVPLLGGWRRYLQAKLYILAQKNEEPKLKPLLRGETAPPPAVTVEELLERARQLPLDQLRRLLEELQEELRRLLEEQPRKIK